jgi:hypothetical protein
MQRKALRTQGEENKPGDEEAVCVRPFPVFPSCPMLASVSLFFPFLYVFVTLSPRFSALSSPLFCKCYM